MPPKKKTARKTDDEDDKKVIAASKQAPKQVKTSARAGSQPAKKAVETKATSKSTSKTREDSKGASKDNKKEDPKKKPVGKIPKKDIEKEGNDDEKKPAAKGKSTDTKTAKETKKPAKGKPAEKEQKGKKDIKDEEESEEEEKKTTKKDKSEDKKTAKETKKPVKVKPAEKGKSKDKKDMKDEKDEESEEEEKEKEDDKKKRAARGRGKTPKDAKEDKVDKEEKKDTKKGLEIKKKVKTTAPKDSKEEKDEKDDKADDKAEDKDEEKDEEAEEKKGAKKGKEKKKSTKKTAKEDKGDTAAKEGEEGHTGTTVAELKRQITGKFDTGDGQVPKDKLKIASWNVNGLRAVLKKGTLATYLKDHNLDMICFNETKIDEDKLNDPEIVKNFPEDYFLYFNCCKTKKGYSGTGIATKYKPLAVYLDLGIPKHDQEGRTITLEFEHFFLISCYVPNAGQALERLDYRTKEWDLDFRKFLTGFKEKKHVIWCGDLNVCHKDIDIDDPKKHRNKRAGFTDREREEFTNILNAGFVDSFRQLHPDVVKYSWWNWRTNAREQNLGWRLDYFVVDTEGFKSVSSSTINNDIMGSDHCPVELEFNPNFPK